MTSRLLAAHRRCAVLLLLALLRSPHHPPLLASASREDLIAGISRLNADVLELRDEIESSISDRCDSIRLCAKQSYGECQSEFTSERTCPSLDELGYAVSECGRGEACNGLFDHTITSVRMPAAVANGPNGNPTNPEVVEAVCYTRTAERWMARKHRREEDGWRALGVAPPQMYFGSSTGVFRIFPARHSRECGTYDPRTRPWYQASIPSTISNSVKPRNVIIVMDTSKSMNSTMNAKTGQTKLSYMKAAVASTVSALTERAKISVIRFGEVPFLVGRPNAHPPFLWAQATAVHKERLIEDINKINARGRSNWVAGLEFAFKLINNSLSHSKAKESQHECELENVALLFFSDGAYNLPDGVNDDDIVELVSGEVAKISSRGDYHVQSFWYSLGNTDPENVEKQISCAVDGYWQPVTSAMAPGNVTQGYQALFSTPMGTNAFQNYTSWSEPYNFSSTGELGYTVSSLVYNRDVEPPRFMGAVGMDIGAEAAKQLYGGTMEETVEVMSEVLNASKEKNFNATCEQQRINLTYCETQSMRHQFAGNGAICLPKTIDLSKDEVVALIPGVDDPDIVLNIEGLNQTINVTDELILGANGTIDSSVGTDDEIEAEEDLSDVEEIIFEDVLNCSKGFLSRCPGYNEYPDDMWRNIDLQGKPYIDRVCCKVGTNTQSDACPKLDEIRDTKISDAAIFGILFGMLAFVEIVGCYFCFYYRKRRNRARV